MPTQRKIDQVEDLKQRMGRATITVSAAYRGLRVQEMDQLRKRMRAASIEVKVIKNNLLRLAADQTGAPELMQIVEGPTALVIAYDDPIEAAKAITEYAQSAPPTFSLLGAFLDGQVVSAADLRDLVRLPPRPVMLAQLAGQIQAPLATLSGLLQAPMRELVSLLQSALSELPSLIDARVRQMEATGEPVQAAAPAETAAEEETGGEAAESAEEEPTPEPEPATPSAGEGEPAAEEPAQEQTDEPTSDEEVPAPEGQPEQEEE
jgi:large subunit ribosomal protein L10